MTPAGAGLKPAEPPNQGENDQEGQEDQRGHKVVHPVPRSLRRLLEEDSRLRQGGADAVQRGHAPGDRAEH